MSQRAASLLLAVFGACVAALAWAGCKPRENTGADSRVAPTHSTSLPADHAPGGLAESKLQAFDVALPAGFHVDTMYPSIASVKGSALAGNVVEYLKPKVAEGKLIEEPRRWVFDHVKVVGKPARTLVITVVQAADMRTTLVTIEDVSPPPAPSTTNPEDIKRAAGIGPDGKLLRKEKLE